MGVTMNNESNKLYATFNNFSTKYLIKCKVNTDAGGIK